MDNNECPLRANIVDNFLESEGIPHIKLPSYSPDLNPVEIFWMSLAILYIDIYHLQSLSEI